MRLVGQNDIRCRGMNGNLAWIEDTAYVAAYYGADDPLAGLAVVDASDPTNPELVEVKEGTPGTRESQVAANAERNMVIVMPWSSETSFGDEDGPSLLQIYDVAEDDPTDLTLVGTFDFGDYVPHEPQIAPDGNTVYVAGYADPPLHVIDVSDMANPTVLTTWGFDETSDVDGEETGALHDLYVKPDGTRAYLNAFSPFNGLSIVDTTEIAEGEPDPEISHISSFRWGPPEEFGISHSAQYAAIEGREYVIAMDETFDREGCPWGWARIIDITEEEYPLQISTFRLDVNKRRHCDVTTEDDAMYSSHYLGVDDEEDASMVFFTWYSSGLRAVDISDPYDPTEIGYYIPPGRHDTRHPVRDVFGNLDVDYTYSWVRYRQETDNIWFTSVHNGLQIVELTGQGAEERSSQ